VFKLVQRKW